MVKTQILAKSGITKACLDKVVQELRQFFTEVMDKTVANCYPLLAVKVKDSIFSQLSRCSDDCEHHLEEILQVDASYININHVDFMNW
jgi:Dynamin central region